MKTIIKVILFYCSLVCTTVILSITNCYAQVHDTLYVPPLDSFLTDTSRVHLHGTCGLDTSFIKKCIIDTNGVHPHGHLTPYISASLFPASAIDTCGGGIFAVYYEDIAGSTGIGFDDPTPVGATTLGQIRRNTFCMVLSYIESVFDFSLIPTTNPIRIHVNQSYAPVTGFFAPAGTGFFATGSPTFPAIPPFPIENGNVHRYVTTGIDIVDPDAYHAEIHVNFDMVYSTPTFGVGISYHNDGGTPVSNCETDLYTVLLHEMTHSMGWLSFVAFPLPGVPPGTPITPAMVNNLTPYLPFFGGADIYTSLDYSVHVGTIFPTTTLSKLVTGPPTAPTLNLGATSPSINCNNNYWINNNPASLNNQPVFSGQLVPQWMTDIIIPSYLNHLDDQYLTWTSREHIAPGEVQEYVMGPYALAGVMRRTYTKGEIQTLNGIMGYAMNAAYTATYPSTVPNHTPFSSKMADIDMIGGYMAFPETIPADFTLVNNTGASLTIDITALPGTTWGPDIFDGDGDPVYIDSNTIINYRGCGSGGNNHNQLTVLSLTQIKYTPRPEFYGRAQFGFRLKDSHESGAFYLVTIDVERGTAVSCVPGGNMVINPLYEEGSETKVLGADEVKPNSAWSHSIHEGKMSGVAFSDGHPFNFMSSPLFISGSGTAIRNSDIRCYMATIGTDDAGSWANSFPSTVGIALPNISTGNRYQSFLNYGPPVFSYYYLSCDVSQCKRYILDFKVNEFSSGTASPIPLQIGFKNATSDFLTPVLNFETVKTVTVPGTGWQHVSIPFWYCGDSASNVMRLLPTTAAPYFVIDSLVLREDTAPPPLIVTIDQTMTVPCDSMMLTAVPGDTACNATYFWIGPGITGSVSQSVVVGMVATTTYSVVLNDGCRTDTGSATVFVTPSVITGPDTVCVGSSITLLDSAVGGTWTSSDTGIATVGVGSGIVTGISPGVVTITYTYCTHIVTYTVTVRPLPAPISGMMILCESDTTTLTDGDPGGTWSSSNTSVATVDPISGLVTGMDGGTVTMTYTLPTACYSTTEMTINPLPDVAAITSLDSVVCIGDTVIFDDATPGGIWTTSDPGIASIAYPPISSGITGIIVGGVSSGTAIISYSVSNACGTTNVTKVVTVTSVPAVSPISGVLGVCSGYTTTVTATPAGGVWTSSNPLIATINPVTGIVNGIAGGTTTISYTVTNSCGSTIVTANVLVNMEPYITTNFIVACQTLPGPAGDGIPSDDPVISGSGCMLVCDSSIVRYYANGVAGSMFTWNIFGGTTVATYPPTYDSIDVMWTTVGLIGSIVLYDTFHHCTDSASACIKVIEKPDALFSSVTTDYCKNSNVVFTDLSTGDPSSPIVYWHWDFGDGHGYSGSGTAEHTYTDAGTYTVKLTVKNQCNCMDSFMMKITISEFDAPDIACPAVVCEGEYATYSTGARCTNFIWAVHGGTLLFDTTLATTYDTLTIDGEFYTYVQGSMTNITVRWDNAAPDGFGKVTLLTPGCGRCDAPTTIKVPVILQNASIAGPDTICVGTPVAYSLPLWPATDYQWGVLGNPGAVFMNCRDDHMTEVKFASAGTYTVHARYQNQIKMCGGNVFKVLIVQPPSAISGPVVMCAGTTGTYSLSGGYGAEWEVRDHTGMIVGTSGGVAISFGYTFLIPGTYLLRAAGAFCADPVTITVIDVPPPVDSIKGEDTVCNGRIYSYKAGADMPGFTYEWAITGGTLAPVTGSNIVTVEWTTSGVKEVKVRRVSNTAPYCAGPYISMNVISETVTPHVTGNTTPCANSYANYSCNYFRGEVYDWAIYPNTVGSVVTGNHAANSRILWNNVAGTAVASVVATVRRCDTIVRDTLVVTVNGSPTIYITTIHDTVCAGTNVGIVATSGADSYAWDFGDGVTETTSVNNTSHVYTNTTTSNIIYHITVTPSSAAGSCMLTGIGDTDIVVLPSIVAHIIRLDTTRPCPGDTAILRVIAYGSIGIASYSWVAGHAPLNDSTYLMYGAESVTALVTATNGCVADPVATLSFYCDPYDTCTVPATGSSYCNYITFIAPGSGTGAWLNTWSTTMPQINGNPGYLNADYAGVYSYYFTELGTECHSLPVVVTVNVVPKMNLVVKCGVAGVDTLFLYNLSSTMPGITGLTVAWEDYTTAPPAVPIPTPYILVPSGTTRIIRLTLSGTLPDGVTPFSCYTEQAINIPPVLTATFTVDTTPVCEKVPVIFDPTVTGYPVYWDWDFDDGATLLLEDGKREFTFDPSLPPTNLRDVRLTVRDSRGCIATHTETVEIYPNILNGDIIGDTIACSSDAPITLTFDPVPGLPTLVKYEWSNGVTEYTGSIGIVESGAYWVTVHDVLRCQRTFPPAAYNVRIIQTPVSDIRGPHHYCVGDDVVLNGFAGTNVQYRWYRGGIPTTGWGNFPVAAFTVGALDVGPIIIRLDVRIYDTVTGMFCFDTDIDTIYVHALPAPPTITGPVVLDCDLYQLRLTASAGVSGTFNWSNGAYGAVNDIYVGGPYRVWFTDLYGCKSKADKHVPLDPNTYQAYFPNGCYEICKGQMPLTLNGVPCASFAEWAWVNSTGVLSTDMNDGMDPYIITTDDKYWWTLDNGLCSKTIGTMNVSTIACNKCQGVGLWADVHCDTANPASYSIDVSFTTTYPDMTYVLGTNLGPVTPFTGTLATAGAYSATLTFTTMSSSPLPDSVTVQLFLTTADGRKCYDEVTIVLDSCWWIAERGSNGSTIPPRLIKVSTARGDGSVSALLVFPNPSGGDATIQYNYGTDKGSERHLVIYDVMGRKMAEIMPDRDAGTWQISAGQWASGMYTIRMESEGKTLQTQRMILAH